MTVLDEIIEGVREDVAQRMAIVPLDELKDRAASLPKARDVAAVQADLARAMAEAAVKGSAGRLPVVAGAGGGYKLALSMAENAAKAGADAILLFAPVADMLGDAGFDCEATRSVLRWLGIEPHIAKRRTAHGSGLGSDSQRNCTPRGCATR